MTDKEKEVYKKLDLILDKLRQEPIKDFMAFCISNIDANITSMEIASYKQVFRERGFVNEINNGGHLEFHITINGIIFEGFEQEKINEDISRNKAERNEWLISRGAALAAIFSGCLVLIELIKFCDTHPHLFCRHH